MQGRPLHHRILVSQTLYVCVCVCVCVCVLSRVRLFATLWTVSCYPPLSLEFSRQDYWNALPFPTPGDPSDPGIEPTSVFPALVGGFFITEPPGKSYLRTCWALLSHSVVSDSLRPHGLVACQAPLSIGILQARILEWVAMPSSRGSSQPRDWTQVSCSVGRFFTIWSTREAQEYWSG